jgi:phosphoribosyl 1,2-cyclic phosphate phosphodiesterase
MKITFLGTGTSQGVPLIGCRCSVCTSVDPRDKRLRCSVMIEDKDSVFVIDSGPDFRQQMLRENVSKLDAILFTHEHKDHIAGLDDVRAFNYLNDKHMDVYANVRVQEALKREFHYIFTNSNYPGIPKINLHTIHDTVPFQVRETAFIPVEALHYKLPVLGYRVGNFSYVTDANYIGDSEKEKLKNSEVLVLNALRRETHVSHFSLDEALQMIEELKPVKAYLIHLSHQMGRHADIEKELPDHIRCAYDGLQLNLN